MNFQDPLSRDCGNELRRGGIAYPSYLPVTSLALNFVAKHLASFEKTLADFNLPEPVFPLEELKGKRFIAEQLSFNAEDLREEAENE